MAASHTFRLGIVDMNNGVANQATRCFRRLFESFSQRAQAANPGLQLTLEHLQPRNLGELPSTKLDLVLSSGGPGAPDDGWDEPWGVGYRKFLDAVHGANERDASRATKLLCICYSFEVAVMHFGVAHMQRRQSTKFGVMPAYIEEPAQQLPFLEPFGYRLFTWEHRDWEAVALDAERLRQLGGQLLAREAHEQSVVNSGDALLGFRFTPGLDGLQFHPEADKPGVMSWVEKPEHRARLVDAYGDDLYDKMIRSLSDPSRLARTFALLIPTWLTSRFNELAKARGLRPLSTPEFDMQQFDVAV